MEHREELDELLTRDSKSFAATYEQAGDSYGFDQYVPAEIPDGVQEAPVVAVSETAVVTAPDEEQLDRVLATEANEQPQLIEEDEDVAWLLEQLGDGDMAVGKIGPVTGDERGLDSVGDDEVPFEPAPGEDVAAALEADLDGNTVESRVALTADEVSEATEETVEATFGRAAADATVEVEDDHVVARGTYDGAKIGATPTDDGQAELTPDDARALVPVDALEYWYQPATGNRLPALWVEVTTETDAAGIRAEAQSVGENELTRPDGTIDGGTSISVQIEPDEDEEVTVFAVDETGAVGRLDSVDVPTDELTESVVPEDAVSFTYEVPTSGDFGRLTIDVTADTTADVLVAHPTEAPGSFADRAGSIDTDDFVAAGTTLETPVDPAGDEVVVFATHDRATGEVARWEGPDD